MTDKKIDFDIVSFNFSQNCMPIVEVECDITCDTSFHSFQIKHKLSVESMNRVMQILSEEVRKQLSALK